MMDTTTLWAIQLSMAPTPSIAALVYEVGIKCEKGGALGNEAVISNPLTSLLCWEGEARSQTWNCQYPQYKFATTLQLGTC